MPQHRAVLKDQKVTVSAVTCLTHFETSSSLICTLLIISHSSKFHLKLFLKLTQIFQIPLE